MTREALTDTEWRAIVAARAWMDHDRDEIDAHLDFNANLSYPERVFVRGYLAASADAARMRAELDNARSALIFCASCIEFLDPVSGDRKLDGAVIAARHVVARIDSLLTPPSEKT